MYICKVRGKANIEKFYKLISFSSFIFHIKEKYIMQCHITPPPLLLPPPPPDHPPGSTVSLLVLLVLLFHVYIDSIKMTKGYPLQYLQIEFCPMPAQYIVT